MFERQKIVLALAGTEPNQTISRLRLVKLCFLLAQEWPQAPAPAVYQFLPYKYGPFSFTLYHELDALIRDGHLQQVPAGQSVRARLRTSIALAPQSARMLGLVRSRYGRMSTSRLLGGVYEQYPWFTIHSEDPRKRHGRAPIAPCAVFTAGYEGLQVDGFLNLLLRSGIRGIIDVRANPVSRKYGFHKSTIARISAAMGLGYEHVPELGIPSAWRAGLDTASDFARLFDRYEREVLPHATERLALVAGLLAAQPWALVCQEADPEFCHRSRLAARLAKQTGLPVRNLRGEGDV